MTGRSTPLLFLSHSGADTEAARALAERIESSPDAKAAGLKVWFDKVDLRPGTGWQAQIERVIDQESTAFAVYLGTRGVVNWVEREVRAALDRADREPAYPFIPILSAGVDASKALPPFAREYQGVHEVETQPEELAKLLRAVLGKGTRQPVALEQAPFVGLRAFEEDDQRLFFGRDREAQELLDRLRRESLVMVIGDSGSGKSSLVKAAVVPGFRGGALAEPGGLEPPDTVWHVVKTRPLRDAFQSLADAVSHAARKLGRSAADQQNFRERIAAKEPDPEGVRGALIDSAPPGAKTLLVVDQFEELLTECPESSRAPFIDALMHTAGDGPDAPIRVMLTMRRDYYNLCSSYPEFRRRVERSIERPDGSEKPAKYLVRRISDEGIREAIEEPLRLADKDLDTAFLNRVIKDTGDQPGDLALLEMALYETWERRSAFEGDLLRAYEELGGVTGALATVADRIFDEELNPEEQALARNAFIRLVRLGETGGTTRRVASRDEFPPPTWTLLQKLASEKFRRLVFVHGDEGGEAAELSHEALVTQWARYQTWLQSDAPHKRVHDRLMPLAKRWVESGRPKEGLLTGLDMQEGRDLLRQRGAWFSDTERALVEASQEQEDRRRRRERNRTRLLRLSALALAVMAVGLGIAWLLTQDALGREKDALAKEQEALTNEREARAKEREATDPAVVAELIGRTRKPDMWVKDDWEAGESVWLASLDLWLTEANDVRGRMPGYDDLLPTLEKGSRTRRLQDMLAREQELRDALDHVTKVRTEWRQRWNEATAAISEHAEYGGLELAPQPGLMPIGVDPDSKSGLWAFWHVASGKEPEREGGKLVPSDDSGMVLVLIPGAEEFWMGSSETPGEKNYDPNAETDESPVRAFGVPAFFLSKYETTRAQWSRMRGGTYSGDGGRKPVEDVSWEECHGQLDLWSLSLPTEAEWEYACRAGTDTPYWSGDETNLDRAGWHLGNSNLETYPVGMKDANYYGLYDTHGNVWEWCQDWYGSYEFPFKEETTERDVTRGSARVGRGGSFGDGARLARSAYRFNLPGLRFIDLGFRPAKHLP